LTGYNPPFSLFISQGIILVKQNKSSFKWRHLEPQLILLCVRWYCRYKLSYRDLEEMMSERGFSVDHTTVWRWVQRYAPEINKRIRPHLRMSGTSYRLDETYVKVGTQWKYLYRAIDSTGQTIHLRRSVNSFLVVTPGSRQHTLAAASPSAASSLDIQPHYMAASSASTGT
jgi:transposase, IS6 family